MTNDLLTVKKAEEFSIRFDIHFETLTENLRQREKDLNPMIFYGLLIRSSFENFLALKFSYENLLKGASKDEKMYKKSLFEFREMLAELSQDIAERAEKIKNEEL